MKRLCGCQRRHSRIFQGQGGEGGGEASQSVSCLHAQAGKEGRRKETASELDHTSANLVFNLGFVFICLAFQSVWAIEEQAALHAARCDLPSPNTLTSILTPGPRKCSDPPKPPLPIRTAGSGMHARHPAPSAAPGLRAFRTRRLQVSPAVDRIMKGERGACCGRRSVSCAWLAMQGTSRVLIAAPCGAAEPMAFHTALVGEPPADSEVDESTMMTGRCRRGFASGAPATLRYLMLHMV